MFAQFRAQYPTGSLVSDLLEGKEGHYVVRVAVQIGGVTLSTGMAAAPTLETAEDRARERALQALGMASPRAYEFQVHVMDHPGRSHNDVMASAQPPSLTGYAPTPDPSDLTLPQETLREIHHQEVLPTLIDPAPPFVAVPPASQERPSSPQGNNGRKAAPHPPALQTSPREITPPPPAPVDLSEIIAQTSVEMKRLGWTEAQGRSYLMKTYEKRSRQKLTDEELLEFLEYLEAQPSPDDSPF